MEGFLDKNCIPSYESSAYRRFEPGEHHITRTHGYEVLLLMLDGVLRFHEDGHPVELHPGEYYIQKKWLLQDGPEPSDSPHYYYIHFQMDWAEEGIPRCGKIPGGVEEKLDELERLKTQRGSPLEITTVFLSILTSLCRGTEKTPKEQLADGIAEYLRTKMTEGCSIDELSHVFLYSRNYIIRVFGEVYHRTPHQYLNELRLTQARQLVQNSNRTLSSIAMSCGFQSYANFYRAYTKAYGVDALRKARKESNTPG